MKLITTLALLCAVFVIALPLRADEPTLEQRAITLFESLTGEQRQAALLPFDSPERNREVFPGGRRPGIQLRNLSNEQRDQAIALVRSFTSERGFEKARAIALQGGPDGLSRFYLTFFGEPKPGNDYAWRIAEHHLTIVHVEFSDGKVRSIGPILLGANPPTLWNDEEDHLIALYGAMTPAERVAARVHGRGLSADPMPEGGIAVSALSTDAQKKAQQVIDGRLAFFAPDIAERVQFILDQQGGVGSLRVIYWGEANARCRDGGRWDFKLGSEHFMCDYESSRGHIHMSLKGKLTSDAVK